MSIFSLLSVRRPVTVLMVSLMLLVLGGVAVTQLPLDLMPDLNFPVITVLTIYPGASPEEVEQMVTRPVEAALALVSGVKNIRSKSDEGASIVMMEFDWGTDMDFASLDIREKVDRVKAFLPPDSEPPGLFKLNPNMLPVISIGLTGKDSQTLKSIAERRVKPRLERLDGVASVSLAGGSMPVIKVQLDPEKMQQKGIQVTQVVQMLKAQNTNFPVGKISEDGREITVRASGEFVFLEEFGEAIVGREMEDMQIQMPAMPSIPAAVFNQTPRVETEVPPGFPGYPGFQLPIPGMAQAVPGQLQSPALPGSGQAFGWPGSAPEGGGSETTTVPLGIKSPTGPVVKLKDIAAINLSESEGDGVHRLNDQDAVILFISKRPGANTVEVVRKVKAEFQAVKPELPGGTGSLIAFDQAEYIQDTIRNLVRDVIMGSLFAVLVILVFLKNVRSTLVIALAIPMSVVTALVLMFLNHITLNVISLGGLALAVGRLVDDAIVVFENTYRHLQEGQPPVQAAIEGAREVAMPVTASTLTTIAVFLPVLFSPGMAGQLFGEMALTVIFALVGSLAVSLTLIPALASRFRGAATGPATGETAPGLMARSYGQALRWVLAHRTVTFAATGILFMASAVLIPVLGMDLIPKTDEGQFTASIQMPPETPLVQTDQVVKEYEQALQQLPEVEVVNVTLGHSGGIMQLTGMESGFTASRADIFVRLSPMDQRNRSTVQVAEQLRQLVQLPPGARITINDMSGLMMGESPIQVRISGPELQVLKNLADMVFAEVQSVPGTSRAEVDYQESRPELVLRVDREKAAAHGLTTAQIGMTLRNAITGEVATGYRREGRETDLLVAYYPGTVSTPEELGEIYLANPAGKAVKLKDVATFINAQGPNSINHLNNERSVTVSGSLNGRGLSSVMADIKARLDRIDLPEGYYITTGGQYQQMLDSFRTLGWALALAVLLVYMIIAAQFESLLHPFTIMFALPLALIGVVASLLLAGYTIDLMAMVGVIMLAGMVVSNSIVLVDFINVLRGRGMDRLEAIVYAGQVRMRPILMTALTTILALIPLAAATGEGAELQKPLAVTVIGGLTTSTFLTLFIVPAVYLALDRLIRRPRQETSVSQP